MIEFKQGCVIDWRSIITFHWKISRRGAFGEEVHKTNIRV